MLFNFTDNFQFSPRLYVEGDPLEVIEKERNALNLELLEERRENQK